MLRSTGGAECRVAKYRKSQPVLPKMRLLPGRKGMRECHRNAVCRALKMPVWTAAGIHGSHDSPDKTVC